MKRLTVLTLQSIYNRLVYKIEHSETISYYPDGRYVCLDIIRTIFKEYGVKV